MLRSLLQIVDYTVTYYGGFFYYLCGAGRHSKYDSKGTDADCEFRRLRRNPAQDTPGEALFKQHARIHLYELAANFYLYDKPHYRKGSYRDDLVDNLRNVAVPGTGVPLSLVAYSRWIGLLFLLTAYPAICFVAAVHESCLRNGGGDGVDDADRHHGSLGEEYGIRLLAPDDWFSYWRLNCVVVGLHAVLNDTPYDYEMENKWTFLQEGTNRGVPVSPFLQKPGAIVVKHRNEEGGLGIFFYKNATAGGDWIIQEVIHNSKWVSSLLPENAPLSTFRVITCSKAAISGGSGASKKGTNDGKSPITALSCVFRAGRAGASTDHDSILFDVDVKTGTIKGGTTNACVISFVLGTFAVILRFSIERYFASHVCFATAFFSKTNLNRIRLG